jgi:hypothetical protein
MPPAFARQLVAVKKRQSERKSQEQADGSGNRPQN